MSTSPASTNLQQALDNYRAALSPYPSSHEKAVSTIIMALADELAAHQPGTAAAPAPSAQPDLQQLYAVITGLSQQVAALQGDLNELKASSEEIRAARNPGGELQALRREVASLRHQLNGSQPQRRPTERRSPPLPGSLAPMRPVEELLDDAPQIDETISEAQMQAYIDRPRVRPEDIQLTEDERKQLQRPHRAKINPSDSVREEFRSQHTNLNSGCTPLLFFLIVVIGFIIMINMF